MAVGLDGRTEVMPGRADRSFGYSIAWRPDGPLLMTGDQVCAPGSRTGRWSPWPTRRANEIVVDGRGYVYVNGADFDFAGGEAPKPGFIKLITPDGRLRQVADDIQFPNGMVISPDDRTLIISESFAGAADRVRHRAGRRAVGPPGVRRGAGAGRHRPRRRRRGRGVLRRLLGGQGGAGRRDPAAGRAGGEPGPFAVMLGGPDAADAVHPDRRMAAPDRQRHRQPQAPDRRAARGADPHAAGRGARRRLP